MALLSLRASRYATTQFDVGCYAYVLADRPVRKLGELVTPAPITMQATDANQLMQVDLIPNVEVDDEEEFLYSVCIYDPEGLLILKGNIIMPENDSDIYDLLPLEQDPNACSPRTVRDNSV